MTFHWNWSDHKKKCEKSIYDALETRWVQFSKIHYITFPLRSTFHLEPGTAKFIFINRALRFECTLLKETKLLQQLVLLFLLQREKTMSRTCSSIERRCLVQTSFSNWRFSSSRLFFISSITFSLVFISSFLIFDRTSAAFNFLVWADNLC